MQDYRIIHDKLMASEVGTTGANETLYTGMNQPLKLVQERLVCAKEKRPLGRLHLLQDHLLLSKTKNYIG
jgi:hypothetical protein